MPLIYVPEKYAGVVIKPRTPYTVKKKVWRVKIRLLEE
jgi:hypothetical protein